MKPGNIPEIDAEIPENAVRLYGDSDAMDDFPVLKAFQQYIDAEQAKARKRLLSLGIFFGVLMFVVISVFVVLLLNVSAKNQALNDRMFEFAMKERDRQPAGSAVVVQPPQDNSAIIALTGKIEAMQKELAESREKAAKAAEDEAERIRKEAAKPKGPTPQELEIKRLKALLAAEQEKHSAEREKQRQAELEEYRRKHYPELYEQKTPAKPAVRRPRPEPEEDDTDDLLEEVDRILDDSEAISYFDSEAKAPSKKRAPAPTKKEYSIPVDVRGSSTRWSVPND